MVGRIAPLPYRSPGTALSIMSILSSEPPRYQPLPLRGALAAAGIAFKAENEVAPAEDLKNLVRMVDEPAVAERRLRDRGIDPGKFGR